MAVTYFHGGVPGLKPGDQIRSATALGYGHYYAPAYLPVPGVVHTGGTLYDPDFVSATTHLGSARGFAARFMHPTGQHEAGDVYEVQVAGPLVGDPDFPVPGVYVRTKRPATITRVVQRGVVLDRREQNRECWPYCFYVPGEPVHSEDGTVLASTQMRENGVRDAYLELMPKWMDMTEFSDRGAIWAPDLPKRVASARYVLRTFRHLEIDTGPHVIEQISTVDGAFLRCRHCGDEFGTPGALFVEDGLEACKHQVGMELMLIASHNCDRTLEPFVDVLSARAPERWEWALFGPAGSDDAAGDNSTLPPAVVDDVPPPAPSSSSPPSKGRRGLFGRLLSVFK